MTGIKIPFREKKEDYFVLADLALRTDNPRLVDEIVDAVMKIDSARAEELQQGIRDIVVIKSLQNLPEAKCVYCQISSYIVNAYPEKGLVFIHKNV